MVILTFAFVLFFFPGKAVIVFFLGADVLVGLHRCVLLFELVQT